MPSKINQEDIEAAKKLYFMQPGQYLYLGYWNDIKRVSKALLTAADELAAENNAKDAANANE